MKCPSEDKLAKLSAGALGSRSAARVEEHLASCDRCRHEYRLLLDSGRLLEQLPVLEPPAGIWEGIRQGMSGQAVSPWRWLYLRRALSPALGFAVALLLALAVWLSWSPPATQPVVPVRSPGVASELVAQHLASQDELFSDRVGAGLVLVSVQSESK